MPYFDRMVFGTGACALLNGLLPRGRIDKDRISRGDAGTKERFSDLKEAFNNVIDGKVGPQGFFIKSETMLLSSVGTSKPSSMG